MWFAFNAPALDKDIGPYIASATESTRYKIDRSKLGIREDATIHKRQKVFSIEVSIPTYQFLEGIRSEKNSVQFTPPPGLYKKDAVTLTATINTSKVLLPKQSLFGKLAEMAIRAVAAPSALFPRDQRAKATSKPESKEPSKELSEEPSEKPSTTMAQDITGEDVPTATSVSSSPRTSSEDSLDVGVGY
jgi:hypothetical protein